jgi:glycerol-3-phosphate acyltransferase PlsY
MSPWILLCAGAAWILGGLPSGLWLARWRGAPDPTLTGSRSSGATNVGRLLGWRWGVAVLVLDLGKGALAAGLPLALGQDGQMAAWCSVAAVLGHCASPFARFRGGKGVATSAGAALVLGPLPALQALAGMVVVLLLFRRMAPASLAGMGIFAVASLALSPPQEAPVWFGFLLLGIVLVTHRQNLDRLRRGVEPTLWGKTAGDPAWRRTDKEPRIG